MSIYNYSFTTMSHAKKSMRKEIRLTRGATNLYKH